MDVADRTGQGLSVRTVLTVAVCGNLAGCGGVGDQDARGRIHCGQAMIDTAHAARERIVAAGIEHHDVQAVARIAHLLDHPVRADGLDFHVAFALYARRRRDQVVAAVELHAVAGVEEEADGIGPRLLEARAEFLDGAFHRDLVGVAARDDLESKTGQRLAHQPGIVRRVGQRSALIGAVADDQRDPGLARVRGGRQRRQDDDRDERGQQCRQRREFQIAHTPGFAMFLFGLKAAWKLANGPPLVALSLLAAALEAAWRLRHRF